MIMRVYLYKLSDADFCELLDAEAIEYKRLPMRPGVVTAAGEGIEIIQ